MRIVTIPSFRRSNAHPAWLAGLRAAFLCLFLMAAAACHAGITYYLDPNGNDTTGNGTSASPWKTLYKAGQAVAANQGHIIHLKAGTYLLDKSVNAFGTSDAVWLPPGTIIEGENTATNNNVTVVLSHQNAAFPGFGINVSTGNFETTPGIMRNLTVDGDNFYGVGGNGSDPGGGGVSLMKISNYTFDNVTIRNFNGSGLRLCVTGNGTYTTGQDISNVEVKNCKFSKSKGYLIGGDGWKGMWIHDSLFDNSDIPNASLDNPSPWGDCVNVNWVGATRINNCTMYAPNYTFPFPWPQQRVQDTICFFKASGGNEIDHNNLYQWVTLPSSGPLNGYDRILRLHDNNIIQTVDRDGEGIELMLSNTDVYNNYISGFPMGVLTDAGGVNAGDTSSDVNDVRIFNNVFRRNFTGSAFDGYGVCYGNGNNTTLNNWAVYNNVFDGYVYGQFFTGSFVKNLNVKNNAFLNLQRVINWNYPTAPITNSTIAYNAWHYTVGFDINPAPAPGANVTISNNLPGNATSLASAGASGLTLSGNLPSPYYAPASGSALVVNAGTANISPTITLSGFTGSAPDIGVYEWTGGGGTNAAPTIATAASASPNPVTGTTTNLSVLGADDGGEANLSYSWATTGTPPASVSFSANGSNAAKNSTATFSKIGTYQFQVTVTDGGGLTTTSSVSVTVNATATSIALSPSSASISTGATQQFTASVRDQFGTALASQPTITWSVPSGGGSVSSSGLYTAPGTAGTATVRASSGSLTANATVTITAAGGGSNNGTGLRGTYFNNKTLTDPSALVRTDATVNFDWGTGSYASGQPTDNFSARWEGQVEAPVSGSFTFTTNSDDGVRLWVNGTQIINNWTDHSATDNSGTITLTAGQKYDIKMEYYESGGGAVAKLDWAYPGQARQNIPQTRLYPASGGGGGSGPVVTSARYYPRSGFASRMNGGQFQGSNDNVNWTTLATISGTPTDGAWSTTPITTSTHYRYLRYLSPNGGYGNIAELEFYAGSTKLTGTGFGTPGSWNNSGNTFGKTLDGSVSTFFDAPDPGNGAFVGIDLGS